MFDLLEKCTIMLHPAILARDVEAEMRVPGDQAKKAASRQLPRASPRIRGVQSVPRRGCTTSRKRIRRSVDMMAPLGNVNASPSSMYNIACSNTWRTRVSDLGCFESTGSRLSQWRFNCRHPKRSRTAVLRTVYRRGACLLQ